MKPGGALVIIDITSIDDGKGVVSEEHRHAVPHAGFSEAEVRETFEGVGLTSFVHKDAGQFEFEGKRMSLFVARAIKPNSAAQ